MWPKHMILCSTEGEAVAFRSRGAATEEDLRLGPPRLRACCTWGFLCAWTVGRCFPAGDGDLSVKSGSVQADMRTSLPLSRRPKGSRRSDHWAVLTSAACAGEAGLRAQHGRLEALSASWPPEAGPGNWDVQGHSLAARVAPLKAGGGG